MIDYQQLGLDALALIRDNGGECFFQFTGGSPSYPIHALADNYSAWERLNSMIQPKDRKLVLAALEIPAIPFVDPEQHELFFEKGFGDILAGSVLRIVSSQPTAPGGVNILYTIQARL